VIASVVDWDALIQVIWVSLVAGVGVTVLFSLVIFGFGRAGEARRSGDESSALAYGALAVLAMVVFAAAVVFGVTVMLNKG
jgi:hypothetical protein